MLGGGILYRLRITIGPVSISVSRMMLKHQLIAAFKQFIGMQQKRLEERQMILGIILRILRSYRNDATRTGYALLDLRVMLARQIKGLDYWWILYFKRHYK